jgi:hypothetical protein
LVEAQAYLDGRLNVDLWTAASTDSQNRALVEATRELCLVDYTVRRVDSTQVLEWPRFFALNPDTPIGAWSYYGSTVIPDRIKNATAELALEFLKAGSVDAAALPSTDGVLEKAVDVIRTVYVPSQRHKGLTRFPRVWRWIKPLLSGSISTTDVIRG